MFNLLHNFHPPALIFSSGFLKIHWYGLFMVLGILAALALIFYLNKYYQFNKDKLFDLIFWLIIWGLVGARLYDIGLQLPYYLNHPAQMIKVWEGGLAIHGAIIAGIIVILTFAYRQKIYFWKLSALLVPGLALAQAFGRWGNYFNQEIFGRPTNLPWGIPIDLINRPLDYLNYNYFQPTFLYESLGCLIISLILIYLNLKMIKNHRLNKLFFVWSTTLYMILYSILRFSLEFIRLDETPLILGIRWPQIISLILILLSIFLLLYFKNHAKTKENC